MTKNILTSISCSLCITFMITALASAADYEETNIEYGTAEITYEITGNKVFIDNGTLEAGLVQDDGNTQIESLRSDQKINFNSLEVTNGGVQKIGGLTMGNTKLDQVDVRSVIDIGSSKTNGGRTLIGHNDIRGVKGRSFFSRGTIKVNSIENNNGTIMMGGYHAGY